MPAPLTPVSPFSTDLRRIEHYTLFLLNSMAAAGSSGLSDGDIDYAIDIAERLVGKLVERGHLKAHE
ncbi:MAG: hypothetical protein Q8O00_08010 [Holophaga sp.]|nr:hypothetical protein [Holophaga sp.]